MLSAENLAASVRAKALTADAIRSMAYVIESRAKTRSDQVATAIGRQLSIGNISDDDAAYLITRSDDLDIAVWDDVEAFAKSQQG